MHSLLVRWAILIALISWSGDFGTLIECLANYPRCLVARGYFYAACARHLKIFIALLQHVLRFGRGLVRAHTKCPGIFSGTACFLRLARRARAADEVAYPGIQQLPNTAESAHRIVRGSARGRRGGIPGNNALECLGDLRLQGLIELLAPLLHEAGCFFRKLANELFPQCVGIIDIAAGAATADVTSHTCSLVSML